VYWKSGFSPSANCNSKCNPN